MKKQTSRLGEERIGKLLFNLSLPALVGLFVIAFYNFVDSIFIGRFVGADALAGVVLAIPAQIIVSSVALMIGIGASSIVSRRLGEKKLKDAEKILATGFILSIAFAIISVIVFTVFGSQILNFFNPGENILGYAKTYLFTISFGFIFVNLSMLLNNVARGEGRAKLAMSGMMVSAFLNIILDYFLIIVFRQGVFGAALATVISQITAFLFLFFFFHSKRTTVHLRYSLISFNKPAIKEIFTIGFPTFIRQVSFALMMIVANKLLLVYGGSIALAALGIVNRIHMMVFMPMFGLVQGMQPIAGFNYGANKYDRVTKSFWLSVKYSTIIGIFLFAIVYFFSEPIVSLFTKDAEVLKLAAFANWFMLLGIFVTGFQMICGGLFQALGYAKRALFSVSARIGLFTIPLMIILSSQFGLIGIFVSHPLAEILSFLLNMFLVHPILKKLRKPSFSNNSILGF